MVKINDWSKSTYSGADIKVIASLSFSGYQKWLQAHQERVFAAQTDPLMIQLQTAAALGSMARDLTDAEKEILAEHDRLLAVQEAMMAPEGFVFELGTAQTISCQSHRPKAAVRSLGRSYVKGYTRGPRTIAGSMIFTVLNEQNLRAVLRVMEEFMAEAFQEVSNSLLIDQLLPIDLTFLFQNEYGSISRMALYGVEFMNAGQTMSIEDLILEEVIQFVARDMDPLADITDHVQPTGHGERELDASSLFKSNVDSYSEWLARVNMRRNL